MAQKTLQLYGYTWKHDGETWNTQVDGRFWVTTWPFGSIHQSKIYVDYDHKMDGKAPDSPIKGQGHVGICLEPGKTRNEAMKKGLAWVKQYQEKGTPSVKDEFDYCYKYYPDLFLNRISIIDHLFFVIGGGHEWLDGAIVSTSPEQHLRSNKYFDDLKETLKETKKILKELRPVPEEEDLDAYRAKHWTTGIYRFYPASKDYSNVCLVPDDVKPEWLELAYEAALLLRDKSGIPDIKSKWTSTDKHEIKRQEDNRELGIQVVSDLERRFPHVKKGK